MGQERGRIPARQGRGVNKTPPTTVFPENGALEKHLFLAVVEQSEEKYYLRLIAADKKPLSSQSDWSLLIPEGRDCTRFRWNISNNYPGDFPVGSIVTVRLCWRNTAPDASAEELPRTDEILETSLSEEITTDQEHAPQIELPHVQLNESSRWAPYEIEAASVRMELECLNLQSDIPKTSDFFPPIKAATGTVLGEHDHTILEDIRRTFFERGLRTPPLSNTLLLSSDGCLGIGPVIWNPSEKEKSIFVAEVPSLGCVSCYKFISPCQVPTLGKELKEILGRTLRLLPHTVKLPNSFQLDFRPDVILMDEQIALWKDQDAAIPFDQWFKRREINLNSNKETQTDGFRNYRLRKIFEAWSTEQAENNAQRDYLINTKEAKAILEKAQESAVAETIKQKTEEIEESLCSIREEINTAEQKRATQAERHQREVRNEMEAVEALRRESESLRTSRDSLSEEVTTLKEKVAEESQRLTTLQKATTDLQAHANTQAEEAEGLLTEAIRRLKDRPAQELAALLPLRTVLGLDNIVVRVELPAPLPIEPASVKRQPTALSPVFALSGANTHEDIAGCRTSLRDSLGARGGDSWKSLAEPLLAAWLAGLLPVVAMEESGLFWQTVARCLCSDRYLPLYAPLAAQEPLDLLGYMEQGIFRPQAHRFADLLCENSGQLSLVALQNIADCHWNSIMAPLLSARAEGRSLPLLHPSQMEENLAYQRLTSLNLPKSLLFAASWDGLYPPAPAFWKHAILLIPDSISQETTLSEQSICELSLSDWQGAHRAAQTSGSDDEIQQAKSRLPNQLGVPLTPALRFFRALRSLGIDAEKSNTLMRHHAILPPLVAQGHTKELGEAGKVKRLRMYLFGEIE